MRKAIYLTPALASISEDPIVSKINPALQQFLSALEEELARARGGDLLSLKRAMRMASFPEPPEYGFGYTLVGRRGNGMGEGALTQYIVDMLLKCPTLAQAAVIFPDALAFIPEVGTDRLTDFVGNVAKAVFIEYTQAKAAEYGFDPACFADVDVPNVWDQKTLRWTTVRVELPLADDGVPVLLVPKEIVRSSAPVRPGQYSRSYYPSRRWLTKEEILRDLGGSPLRLLHLMKDIFAEASRYRPRREYRDEE